MGKKGKTERRGSGKKEGALNGNWKKGKAGKEEGRVRKEGGRRKEENGGNVEVFCGHSKGKEKCVVLNGMAGRVSLLGSKKKREKEQGTRQCRRGKHKKGKKE